MANCGRIFERSLGQSCPGPADQSLPINQNGILALEWQPHVDEFGNHNWRVHLKTDLINYSHPCGDGYFTLVSIWRWKRPVSNAGRSKS